MLEHIEYWKEFDKLIRERKTGSLKQMASQFQISERTIKSIIKSMKEKLGSPIEFSRKENSYIYIKAGHLRLGWKDCSFDRVMGQIREVLKNEPYL